MSLSLAAQGRCIYQTAKEYKTGSVYKVYEGTFSDYPRVFIKQTSSLNRAQAAFARNDIFMMQQLSDCENIARLFHVAVGSSTVSLIVQRYEFNLLRYLKLLVQNQRATTEYDEPEIFRQVFAALSFMHGKMISHRNVKLKNVYIHRVSGKNKNLFTFHISNQYIFRYDMVR
jgi:serine/threonine protein kinase